MTLILKILILMPDIKKCPVFKDCHGFWLLNSQTKNLPVKINGNKSLLNFNNNMKNTLKLMSKEVSDNMKTNNH